MRSAFAVCSVDDVAYRGNIIENHPVNLALCYSIKKTQTAYYPDNDGIPSILFGVLDKDISHKWVYPNKTMRDKDYNKLLEGAINGNEIN